MASREIPILIEPLAVQIIPLAHFQVHMGLCSGEDKPGCPVPALISGGLLTPIMWFTKVFSVFQRVLLLATLSPAHSSAQPQHGNIPRKGEGWPYPGSTFFRDGSENATGTTSLHPPPTPLAMFSFLLELRPCPGLTLQWFQLLVLLTMIKEHLFT